MAHKRCKMLGCEAHAKSPSGGYCAICRPIVDADGTRRRMEVRACYQCGHDYEKDLDDATHRMCPSCRRRIRKDRPPVDLLDNASNYPKSQWLQEHDDRARGTWRDGMLLGEGDEHGE